jgi:hypothetical protein
LGKSKGKPKVVVQEGLDLYEPLICIDCGYEFDRTSVLSDEQSFPDEGAVSLCAWCGNLAGFERGEKGILRLRRLTVTEKREALEDKQTRLAIAMVMELRARYPE